MRLQKTLSFEVISQFKTLKSLKKQLFLNIKCHMEGQKRAQNCQVLFEWSLLKQHTSREIKTYLVVLRLDFFPRIRGRP